MSACSSGKAKFPTQIKALEKIGRAREWHNVEFRTYRCPECRQWHLARKKTKEGKEIPLDKSSGRL